MKFSNALLAVFAVVATILSAAHASPLPNAAAAIEDLDRRDANPAPYCWLGDSGVDCENLL
ncbi:hypothetical protein HK405_005264, partial [Cladochytrium tenue]